jgi:hypothetical protein
MLETWKLQMEHSIDVNKAEVTRLGKFWDRSVLEGSTKEPSIFDKPNSASERPPTGSNANRPDGHRVSNRTGMVDLGQY